MVDDTTQTRRVTTVTRTPESITIAVRGAQGAPLTLMFGALSSAVKAEALGYGMEVRLTRATAIEHDTKTGRAASPQEKYDRVKKLIDHYASGTESWTMSGGGGGGLSSDTRALIEALSRAFEIDLELAELHVREMSSSERDALRVDAEVKPYLDDIYAERAKAAGSDTRALIERLKSKV